MKQRKFLTCLRWHILRSYLFCSGEETSKLNFKLHCYYDCIVIIILNFIATINFIMTVASSLLSSVLLSSSYHPVSIIYQFLILFLNPHPFFVFDHNKNSFLFAFLIYSSHIKRCSSIANYFFGQHLLSVFLHILLQWVWSYGFLTFSCNLQSTVTFWWQNESY